MQTRKLLFALIREAVLGGDPAKVGKLSVEEKEKLYQLSSAHEMAHIVGGLLQKYGNLEEDEPSKKFKKAINVSFFRYVQIQNALQNISDLLEKAKIPFVPLKGAVIRSLYPDPALRTSCDIDILVPKEQLEKAVEALVSGGLTAYKRTNSHDIPLDTVDHVHLELHFGLTEGDETMVALLEDAWEHTYPQKENGYCHSFTNEFFVLHQIVHMLTHFVCGGCGIRPFLDLYLIRQKTPYDEAALKAQLEKAGILTFYENVVLLANAWFGNGEHTSLTLQMEDYLLRGGVYGSMENRARNTLAKHGKLKHFFAMLFPPAVSMKKRYTAAEKHPILLPWFYVWRVLCFLVKPYAKTKVKIHLEVVKAGETDTLKKDDAMMKQLKVQNHQVL